MHHSRMIKASGTEAQGLICINIPESSKTKQNKKIMFHTAFSCLEAILF